ncbi:MAG: hypothetical protein AVDCRST_MAG11-677, partial [uncultured Gemmatimonadaceae bacterium]
GEDAILPPHDALHRLRRVRRPRGPRGRRGVHELPADPLLPAPARLVGPPSRDRARGEAAVRGVPAGGRERPGRQPPRL